MNDLETEKTIEKISETKSWFFAKMNKIAGKPLGKLTKKKRKKTQIISKMKETLQLISQKYKGS